MAFALGRCIPSHALHVFPVRDSFVVNPFTEVTPNCQLIELPRECGVELLMGFPIAPVNMCDPRSGRCVVAHTAFAGKTAAILLI